ncbi:hypothetical protein FLK61_28210 [Paenalkalicoccus suaedae]|uniref:Uncharacterized protein n=1 Tax=Paenalkalicoccus suaedae TaxID=2592382 RepID=A0A859FCV7_9BACI|nr:hypothetical protein [Paenalkalicoccus suaedae]QKS70631.1 hypothetical protein FLK61_28210 [Paenalkalicoccus suaedae]
MKHILPLGLIGLIIIGVLYFLQDDYPRPLEADFAQAISDQDFTATFFIDGAGEEREIGLRLDLQDMRRMNTISELEFFVDGIATTFYYQDLVMNEFNGSVTKRQSCLCEENDYRPIVRVNFKERGEVYSATYSFNLQIEEPS